MGDGRVVEADRGPSAAWVVLTTGGRGDQLRRSLASIRAVGDAEIVLVANGADPAGLGEVAGSVGARVVAAAENLGVPAGRDLGMQSTDADIVFFLDDDAEVRSPTLQADVLALFAAESAVGVVGLRLVDEQGVTARRHVPRAGAGGAGRSGPVVTFLGGACAIRRRAYQGVGGYWGDLFYGHEELDLAWRLIDAGWSVHYSAPAIVFHPATPISRHEYGWRLTGRNRVLVACRNLPLPVAAVHVAAWSLLGSLRAGDGRCRRAYWRGLREGWALTGERRPMRWATVWRLVWLGRPPVV